jgi:hypothetical protein
MKVKTKCNGSISYYCWDDLILCRSAYIHTLKSPIKKQVIYAAATPPPLPQLTWLLPAYPVNICYQVKERNPQEPIIKMSRCEQASTSETTSRMSLI